MSHPFENETDDFTPTAREVRTLRDFLNLDADLNAPALRTRTPRNRRNDRATVRPSAATMFHRLDVCDLIG